MRLILLGGPGAGKGTQSTFIIERYKIPQVSTGDMLRAEIEKESDIGKEAKRLMDDGNLVPDEMIIDLVDQRLALPDCQGGYLLDGFPRTISQADALKNREIYIDAVVELAVDDEEIVKRMSGRRAHLSSGRTYHIDYNPPKREGLDDITDEPLVQRTDDKEDVVRNRLSIYHDQTEPLINYYSSWAKAGTTGAPTYKKIDGIGDVSDVRDEIFATLDAIRDANLKGV